MSGYEAVIGIETHVELRTASKMFCGCPVDFGAEPNTAVCPVCLGLPGALPVPNERAVEWTIALGLALGCEIAPESVFHRKNYFYADLPKNYQISQYDLPLCSEGRLDVEVGSETAPVGITRVHLEEDTGKSTHVGSGGRITGSEGSLIDFNRSGVPLVEVVSEPDITSPEQARAYATELREIVLALGISDARLEEGSMRFDANVSLRPAGTSGLGVKVEVKNMNSLRSLQRALAFEIERQEEVLSSGGSVAQETRHWEEEARRTSSGRSKEESSDYRYLREPDLVPVAVSGEMVDRIGSSLPEMPAVRRLRFRDLGLDPDAARLVAGTAGFGALLEEAVAAGAPAMAAATWITGEVTAHLRSASRVVEDTPLTGARLAEIVAMVDAGDLSSTAAKEVLGAVMDGAGEPRAVAEERDLIQITDTGFIEEAVDRVLAEHPEEVERLRGGEGRLVGFLVGMVMKATGGKADPRQVSELIREVGRLIVGAIVFDCDGVLADSEPPARAAWRAVLDRLGHPATDDDVLGCTGLGYLGSRERLARIAPLPPADDLWADLLDALADEFASGLRRFDDAVDAVGDLVLMGVPLAVASSSPRDRLDLTLQHIGLAGRFDATVAGDEVARAKPAPDVYLEAARLLGVAPHRCIAVEDTGHGAAAAVAAGMRVVGVVRDASEAGPMLAAGAGLVDEVGASELAAWAS